MLAFCKIKWQNRFPLKSALRIGLYLLNIDEWYENLSFPQKNLNF
jgi:hypothetical protein